MPPMRLAIIGQQDFGKAVLGAFLERKHEVAAVFCAPEKPGARVDPLKAAAQERGLPVFQFASLRSPEAHDAMRSLNADLGIMAYVLQFAPDSLVTIPRLGTIQYHPSLLPRYRGPSSINWPIIRGDAKTGLTIFRPTEGLDEGPIVLQKECPIGPDDTLGDIYFNRLFPINHTEAMVRDLQGRLRRESWLVSKGRRWLDIALHVWIAWRNYVRRRFNWDPMSPAQLLGFVDRRMTAHELLSWRQDWGRGSVHPLARRGESVEVWERGLAAA